MKNTSKPAVYAFPIANAHVQFEVFTMPKGAEIIEFGLNEIQGIPTLWALVDKDAETEERVFVRFDTGADIGHNMDDLTFVGRTLGANKSKSKPGTASLRTTFWFEAKGDTAQIYLDMKAATDCLKTN